MIMSIRDKLNNDYENQENKVKRTKKIEINEQQKTQPLIPNDTNKSITLDEDLINKEIWKKVHNKKYKIWYNIFPESCGKNNKNWMLCIEFIKWYKDILSIDKIVKNFIKIDQITKIQNVKETGSRINTQGQIEINSTNSFNIPSS